MSLRRNISTMRKDSKTSSSLSNINYLRKISFGTHKTDRTTTPTTMDDDSALYENNNNFLNCLENNHNRRKPLSLYASPFQFRRMLSKELSHFGESKSGNQISRFILSTYLGKLKSFILFLQYVVLHAMKSVLRFIAICVFRR